MHSLPLLSLCMIVKNEEAMLPRCLKSVSGLVDEIIIVDTGSTDSTREIGKKFNARVFDCAWDDNFSNARNFSLAQASGEWILVLDADEVLVFESRDQVKKLLSDPGVEGYFIRIVNLLGALREFETSEDFVVRLFRNKPEYRFTGAIHEQVRLSISHHAGENFLKRAPLTIYHDGYLSELIQKKSKVKRNTSVIIKALREQPGNPFLLYSLGCEYFVSDCFKEALSLFRQALSALSVREGYMPDLIIKMGLCLYKLGELSEMDLLITRYKDLYPLAPEQSFLSGLTKLDMGKLSEAEKDINECMMHLSFGSPHHLGIKKHQVYQVLGEINEAKHSWDKAVKFYFLALQSQPNYLYPLHKLINIYKNHHPRVRLEDFLGFCPPDTKYRLLTKLDWEIDDEAVIYLILGLIRDIMISDLNIAQLFIPRFLEILNDKQIALKNLRTAATAALAKAAVTLACYKAVEVGNTSEICKKLMDNIKDILLWKDENKP
ncbi:family 2 glycosyl transferase [Thermincola ferriacetica]|uniref:Family 2 glycosyl transferase n=1 Tax=Thermincola ferriacetica TaxID=281456 RepID=A0A0L6W4B4_9FIRM|nr:glycosyltransferase family 2 protein [Thermincola ferriacetica]KNZ70380.1 family 2 glycosyl transferase [Thermincola ferriacetica]